MKQAITGHTKAFITIWIGQLISLIGSELTSFALGIWVYRETGSITLFSLIALAAVLPSTLISPFAGVLVDRFNKRHVMILSDLVAGLSTLVIALLFYTGQLEVWHIYISAAVSSTGKAFQLPAYNAAIPLLVANKHLGRANGMVQGAQAIAQLISPAMAGFLVLTIELDGIFLIDVSTFLVAVLSLALIRVPHVATQPDAAKRPFWQEATQGWAFVRNKPGLMGILFAFAASNFLTGMASVLITPLILSFSSAQALGNALSIGGIGMLIGSLFVGIWGGPQRRVYGILGFGIISSFGFILVGWQPSILLITIGAFIVFFNLATVNSCNQSLWQSKTPSQLRGRIFALLHMVSSSLVPLAFLVAGPLADNLFEPLMAADGALVNTVGRVLGVGTGRGIGLMFILIGFLNLSILLWGYFMPRIRLVELELPNTV